MKSIRQLIREANPVPELRSASLSERAERELAALIITEPEARRVSRRTWYETLRAHRVGFAAVTAGAVAAIALSGAVVTLARQDTGQSEISWEPFYRDTQSLEGRADTIVRATIRTTRVERKDGMLETIASATVLSVAKGGTMVGDNIKFAFMTPRSNPDAVSDVKRGGEYIVLLESRVNEPPFLVNSYQGYYVVVDNRIVPNPTNPIDLSAGVKKRLGLR